MYDELVKKLRSHNGWALNETLDEAADAIEQLSNAGSAYGRGWTLGYDAGREESKSRWIFVTEKLPEAYKPVLLYNGEGIATGYMHRDKRFTVNGSYFPSRPTHWMPLPEPPKEGEA